MMAILFASTASNATILAINSSRWSNKYGNRMSLGNPKFGYKIDASPIVWNDYIIAGSAGGSLPPDTGLKRKYYSSQSVLMVK